MKELLIEKWFPIKEASIESGRERGATFPPLYRLSLWWARRPQTASRFISALSALPTEAYSDNKVRRLFTALGLRGDPTKVSTVGRRSYGYPVFEGVNPTPRAYINKAEELWGRRPVGADLMAGGGAIPFEMARVGFGEVIAGEYNPIAYTILKASLEYPSKFKGYLVNDVETYARASGALQNRERSLSTESSWVSRRLILIRR